MAIDFGKQFGAASQQSSSRRGGTNTSDQPKAKVWLNVGYSVDSGVEGKYDFVSLPVGIPLDTMEGVPVRGNDPEYREFQEARNGLMEQLQAAASKLKPGESGIIHLEVQLRHVAEEQAPTPSASNRFARQVELVVTD